MAALPPSEPSGTEAAGISNSPTRRWEELAREYDSQPVRPPRLLPGVLGFCLGAAVALGAQAFGLRSITAYATMRAQLAGLEDDRQRIELEVQSLRTERGRISGDLESSRVTLTEMEGQLTKVNRERDLATAALTDAQEGFSKAREARIAADAKTASANSAYGELQRSISDSRNLSESLRQQETTLKTSVEQLTASRSSLDMTLDSLGKETRALNTVSAQSVTARDDLSRLQGESRKLTVENSAAEARRVNFVQSAQDLASIEAQKVTNLAEVTRLTVDLEAQRVTLADLIKKVGTNRKTLAEQEGQLASVQDQIGELSPKVKQLMDLQASLRDQVAGLEASLLDRSGRLRALDERYKRLEADAPAKAGELAASTAALEQRTKELDRLQLDVDKRSQELESLRAARPRLVAERDQVLGDVSQARAQEQSITQRIVRLREQETGLTSGFEALLSTLRKAAEAAAVTQKQLESTNAGPQVPKGQP